MLVSLDAAEPSSRLRQAQATVDAQRAVVSEAEARAAAATRVAERFKRLSERGAETSSSAEDSAATALQAEAAALAAKGQLEQSVAALQVARVGRSTPTVCRSCASCLFASGIAGAGPPEEI